MPADGPDSPTPDASERLVVLSDGVVAIALTLLILGIQVPSPSGLSDPDSISQLAGALFHTLDSWLSYVVSFFVIGQFWLLHRQVFRGVREDRDGLAALNFLFLFTISVMPFASDLLGKYPQNSLAVIIFSANLILANLAIYWMMSLIRRRRLLDQERAAAIEGHWSPQSFVNLFIYVLAIPVALVNPDLGKLCWLGLALAPRINTLIARRRAARSAA